MDIEMPDGSVISGIPEGTSRAEVMRRYQADQPPETDYSPLDSAIGGLSQGLSLGFSDEIDAGARTALGSVGELVTGNLPDVAGMYAKNLAKVREHLSGAKRQHPNTNLVSDVVGSIGSGMGMYRGLGALAPKTWLGNAVMGAGEGAAQAVGRGDTYDDVIGKAMTDIPMGAAAGAGGHLVGEFMGRMGRGQRYTPDGMINQRAEDLGLKLSPAQALDDPALHKVEAAMRSDPGFSKAFEGMDAANAKKANEIVSGAMGRKVPRLTSDVYGDITDDISRKFNDATSRGERISLDQNWLDDLDTAESRFHANLGKRDVSDKLLTDARSLLEEGDSISPAQYQQFYSDLGKDLEGAATKGDFHEVQLYQGIRRALDNAVDRSAEGLSDEFRHARKLYKSQMLMEKPGVLDTDTGNVSPLVLGNKLRQTDKRGYMRDKNQSDLYNLARVFRGKRSGIGDSGTATRSKTALDYALSPIRESMGNVYLSGKYGTSLLGPSSGVGAKFGAPVSNAAPALLELMREQEEEERRRGLL